jgi:hypothetical protein
MATDQDDDDQPRPGRRSVASTVSLDRAANRELDLWLIAAAGQLQLPRIPKRELVKLLLDRIPTHGDVGELALACLRLGHPKRHNDAKLSFSLSPDGNRALRQWLLNATSDEPVTKQQLVSGLLTAIAKDPQVQQTILRLLAEDQ